MPSCHPSVRYPNLCVESMTSLTDISATGLILRWLLEQYARARGHSCPHVSFLPSRREGITGRSGQEWGLALTGPGRAPRHRRPIHRATLPTERTRHGQRRGLAMVGATPRFRYWKSRPAPVTPRVEIRPAATHHKDASCVGRYGGARRRRMVIVSFAEGVIPWGADGGSCAWRSGGYSRRRSPR